MKRMKIFIVSAIIIVSAIFMKSCDVTNITEYNYQFAIEALIKFNDKTVPSQSLNYIDLNDYDAYKDNKDVIDEAEILHFNYWIEDIKTQNNLNVDSIVFEYINFYMIPSNKNFNTNGFKVYNLGTLKNARVADYYRVANNILRVSDSTGKAIAEAVKENPYFVFKTEYGPVVGSNDDTYFDFINARMNMTVKFNTKL